MIKTCPICHNQFETNVPFQIYCGSACSRFSNRNFDRKTRETFHGQKQAFDCICCGKHVEPKDGFDRRTKFCSQKCEKRYWKRKHKTK